MREGWGGRVDEGNDRARKGRDKTWMARGRN